MLQLGKKTIFIFLLIILAIAAFFRFYKLAEIPPGLYPDVAINANDALLALKTHDFKVFYPENNGREGLFINLIALSFYFFGISVWAIKFVPAIIGILTVLGLYLMTRELFRSELIALLSTFFLATSFWHVLFSRLGFRAIMVPFILVWGFYFLFRATRLARTKHTDGADKFYEIIHWLLIIGYWLIAGLLFGLGFHTYIAYRVAPAILGVFFLIEVYNFWQRRNVHYYSSSEAPSASEARSREVHNTKVLDSSYGLARTIILPWLIFFIAVIIAASPMLIYFYNNPQDFMGRTGQVSVLASPQPTKELAISTAKSLGMFNIWGDCNWRHNYACQPALPLPIGILFLIGLLWSVATFWSPAFSTGGGSAAGGRRRQNNSELEHSHPKGWTPKQISLFLLAWFFIMLLPEILTNEGLPHSLRSIGAIPVVYIFIGIGGWWIFNRISAEGGSASGGKNYELRINKFNKVFIFLVVLFCVWLVFYSYDLYFIRWGENPEVKGAFTQQYVDIGNYLNFLPENVPKYVIVNEGGVPVPYPDGIPMPAQTIMFIEQTSSKPNKAFYLLPEELKYLQKIKSGQEIVFVLMKYDEKILDELKQKIPQGKIFDENGIWTFQIKS